MGVAGDLRDLAEAGRMLARPVGPGTRNMAVGPAMSREEAWASFATGMRVADEFAEGTDVFATGEMGIGNTTPSSAITAVLSGADGHTVTGRGTGLDDAGVRRKAEVVERAIDLNRPNPEDPVDVLAKVGGFEIGGIAGLILGAAARRRPVIVDGFISTAGALLAQALCPASADYMIASHCSVEPGHGVAWTKLGKVPLLDLGLRLGEGTGAVLAMHLVTASAKILAEMATFEDAGIGGGAP